MRTGSLFSGYLGLDLAVREVFPEAETAFVADIDAGACKVLAHRAPEAVNLGDVSTVDWTPWAQLIAVLTAGFPCQDVSAAGKRAGLMKGTRTGLWHETARAIRELRPSLVLLENVRGLLSARGDDPTADHLAAEATAAAAKQLTDWIDRRHAFAVRQGRSNDARDLAARRLRAMGCRKRALDRARRHERRLVRAVGTVLGSLADLGFDAAWCGLRAADVGAPHGRWRIFILAWPSDATGEPWGSSYGDRATAGHSASVGRVGREAQLRGALDESAGDGAGSLLPTPTVSDGNGAGQHGDGGLDLRTAVAMLPTPRATDGTKGGPNQRGSSGDLMLPSAVALLQTPSVADAKGGHAARGGDRSDELLLKGQVLNLLPTPAVNDMGAGKTPEGWDAWTDRMKAEHGNGNGHGASLSIEAMRLLPTPKATNNENRQSEGYGGGADGNYHELVTGQSDWGKYAAAIHRWEQVTRPAPTPTETRATCTTEPKTGDNPRLSCTFDEWLMGLPAGWITDVPDVTHNEALKLCGNGVVPQQGAAALRWLLIVRARALAAVAA